MRCAWHCAGLFELWLFDVITFILYWEKSFKSSKTLKSNLPLEMIYYCFNLLSLALNPRKLYFLKNLSIAEMFWAHRDARYPLGGTSSTMIEGQRIFHPVIAC